MNDVLELLDQYCNSAGKLFEHFDCSYCWIDVADHTDDYWNYDENSVSWGEQDDDYPTYSEELREAYPKEKFTMIVINTCTGDGKSALVFDNAKKKTWEEE